MLAPYHGEQAGHGWSGLRNGLDDQRPSRARDHRCGLDSWDLARKDSWRFSYGIGLEVRTGRARTSLGYPSREWNRKRPDKLKEAAN